MKKKKTLHMDGKKRVTLGKLISKDTTFFEVEKKADGTLIFYPKSDLPEEETWIYSNKAAFKSIKQGLKDIKKGSVIPIQSNFWSESCVKLDEFKYTKEFLQTLEPIIVKQDSKTLENIKKILEQIVDNNNPQVALQNIKTYDNTDVFQLKITEKLNLFWTERESDKIIVALTKNT